MSFTRTGIDDSLSAILPHAGRLARIATWSVIHALLLFAEHLAEFLAPLCLFAGAIWWAAPRILGAITLEGPAADVLQTVRDRMPADFYLDGSYYSAHGLIVDGLWLIGVVAVARTLSTAATALLLDRR